MAILSLVPLVAAGCGDRNNTAEGADKNVKNAGERAKQAVDRAADSAKQAGKTLSRDAGNAATTGRIKTAFAATKQPLDWTHINVDTKDGVVHLKGVLPDAAQKQLAVRIATDIAGPKIPIKSELQVGKAAK